MANYKWTFSNVGGATRVRIQSAEDIRHLGELDKKMWTVLSCPVSGLEICEESLKAIDIDGDGKLRIKEVVAAADKLCAVLKDPSSLFEQKDEIAIANLADETIAEVAKKVAADKQVVTLADVDAAIAAVAIEEQPVPAAPLEADVIAAYKEKSAEYAAYFEQEKLQKIGLALIPEETPKPGMTEKKFLEMGQQIADWEAAKAAAETANADALAAAKAVFEPLRTLLLVHRDFYRLLKNFVTFEDFYDTKKTNVASFQAGTLVIDQRACHLCIRVNDIAKHDVQAPLSGIYLIYCNCESKKLGKKMQIVAAMTQGEIKNLSVGKNAIFYDNEGNDYHATVTKIIDNPISIRQAFWTPYRKFGNWIQEKINKSAAEKDAKAFDDMKTQADSAADPNAPKKQAFDIAKFAGIFAAIGMALGMIGTALVEVAAGMKGFSWWQYLLILVCILLVISGPSMIMAWMKLRRRNLAPVLNANGWAVNADTIISVPFGVTLTEQVQFPLIKLTDPFAKKGMPTWKKALIWIAVLIVLCAATAACLYYFGVWPFEQAADPQSAEIVEEAVEQVVEESAAL
ncbi:MAG: hypothetical protein IJ920_05745 [Paludibacteraceae bacterium]|nr:hypothetical protein [Paludibacteraceae bacterium]